MVKRRGGEEMVHSEKGPATRAMFYNTPALGLPKSPSFHSGLDLMASSLGNNMTSVNNSNEDSNPSSNEISTRITNDAFTKQLPLLLGKG